MELAMNWYTERCPICRGSLHDDLDDKGWVTCFSCGRSFTAHDVRPVGLAQAAFVQVADAPAVKGVVALT